MLNNLIFVSTYVIIAGILYGALFHFGKQYLLTHQKPLLDVLFTLLRIGIIAFLFYYLYGFIAANSILMLILFVSSYLSTVAILNYNT
jgi:hypothetical protein